MTDNHQDFSASKFVIIFLKNTESTSNVSLAQNFSCPFNLI